MREPDSQSTDSQERPPTRSSRESKNIAEAALVAQMYEGRAKFAQFRAQIAEFRRGYRLRLYETLQFVYEMDKAFRDDHDEMCRFLNDEFFDSNRQKPDETNLLRHLLYFLANARTEEEREKWLKPAAVLEHLRSQGVPVHEVVSRIKEGHGYNRIYKSLSGKHFPAGNPADDLDVLFQNEETSEDHAPAPEDPVAVTGEPPNTLSDTRHHAALLIPDPIADQDDEVIEPEASPARGEHITGSASTKAANFNGDAISGEAGPPKRMSRTRVNLETTVPVVIPPYDPTSFFAPFTVHTMINAKRGALFFEVKPPEVDGWREVTAKSLVTIDDDTLPWHELIDPGMFRRRERQSGPIITNVDAQERSLGGAASATNQAAPPASLAAPDANERRGDDGSPLAPKQTVSARPLAQGVSAATGKAGSSGAIQSKQDRLDFGDAFSKGKKRSPTKPVVRFRIVISKKVSVRKSKRSKG